MKDKKSLKAIRFIRELILKNKPVNQGYLRFLSWIEERIEIKQTVNNIEKPKEIQEIFEKLLETSESIMGELFPNSYYQTFYLYGIQVPVYAAKFWRAYRPLECLGLIYITYKEELVKKLGEFLSLRAKAWGIWRLTRKLGINIGRFKWLDIDFYDNALIRFSPSCLWSCYTSPRDAKRVITITERESWRRLLEKKL